MPTSRSRLLSLPDPDDPLAPLLVARTLLDRLIADHWDEARGLFLIAAHGDDALIAAPAEVYDGASPSANAVAVTALQRLHALTGDPRYNALLDRLWASAAPAVAAHPTGHAAWLRALDERLAGERQVVVVAPEASHPDGRRLYEAARAATSPGDLVLLLTPDLMPALEAHFPPLAAFACSERGALAYVCHDFRCEAPVADVAALRALLTPGPS